MESPLHELAVVHCVFCVVADADDGACSLAQPPLPLCPDVRAETALVEGRARCCSATVTSSGDDIPVRCAKRNIGVSREIWHLRGPFSSH